MAADASTSVLVRVDIPALKTQKCIPVNLHDSVWAIKNLVREKVSQELPNDFLNYGIYLPGSGQRLGKYLDDSRGLAEYVLQGNVPRLELRYKSRDYSTQVSLSEKAIAKVNNKVNQKKLLEFIGLAKVDKVSALLESGLDPNFLTEDGNTPLGVVCGRGGQVQLLTPLLSGGAHIDFRGKEGLTALHRAAIGGNAQAIKVLLSYGASPSYRDSKGLTALYHTVIMGDDTESCEALLMYRAEIGVQDQNGWTELHQVAKYGHIRHGELLIRYGADMNAQNSVGNTPLHVAASYGQMHCVGMLLIRGADKEKTNFSNQTCSQVAILCGHHSISATISAFAADKVERITEPPEYHPNARMHRTDLYQERASTATDTSAEQLVSALAGDWESKQEPPLKSPSPGLGKKKSADQDKNSDQDSISIHSTSSSQAIVYPSGPTPPSPTPEPPPVNPRERLYLAKIGKKYIAIEDVEPVLEEWDLQLWKGMRVDGRNGYWEGKAGGRQGWFPSSAVKEATDEELESGRKLSESQRKLYFCNIPGSQDVPSDSPSERRREQESNSKKRVSNIHDVIIVKGPTGMGFSMKGIKATKSNEQFHPNPQVPALQYISAVAKGGAADVAGLKQGDFLIEVDGTNVTYNTHDQVVAILKKTGSTIRMKVITPLNPLSSVPTREQFSRKPSSSPAMPHTSSSSSLVELAEKETVIDNDSDSLSSEGSVTGQSSSLKQDYISARDSPSQGSATKTAKETSREMSPSQQEENEDSSFAKALKDKRKHLQRFSTVPANLGSPEPTATQPEPPGTQPSLLPPTQPPQLSVSAEKQPEMDLSSAILKAHQNRSDRASLKGASSVEARQEQQRPRTPSLGGNSLANSMLARIEQLSLPQTETGSAVGGSEFDDVSTSPHAKRNPNVTTPKQGVSDAKMATLTKMPGKSIAPSAKLEGKPEEPKSKQDIKSETARPETKTDIRPETKPDIKPETKSAAPIAKPETPNSKVGSSNFKPGTPITKPEAPVTKVDLSNTEPEVSITKPGSKRDVPSTKPKMPHKLRIDTPGAQSGGVVGASIPTKGQVLGTSVEQDKHEWKAALKTRAPPSPKPNSTEEHLRDRRQVAPPSNVIVAKQFESDETSEPESVKVQKTQAVVMIGSEKLPPVPKSNQSLPLKQTKEIKNTDPGAQTPETDDLPKRLVDPHNEVEDDNTGSVDIIPPPLGDIPPPIPPLPDMEGIEGDSDDNLNEDESVFPPPPLGSSHTSFADEEFLPPPLVSPQHLPYRPEELSPQPPPPTFGTQGSAHYLKSIDEEKVAEPGDVSLEDMEAEFGNLVSELASLGNSDVSGLPPPLMVPDDDEIPSPTITPPKKNASPTSSLSGPSNPATPPKPGTQHTVPTKPAAPNAKISEPAEAPSPVKGAPKPSNEKVVVAPEQVPPLPPPPPQQEATLTSEQQEGSQTKAIADWSVDDVCQWLKSLGLEEYTEPFSDNEITGEHLVDLTKDDLKELGVKKLGHQKTLLAKIGQLKD